MPSVASEKLVQPSASYNKKMWLMQLCCGAALFVVVHCVWPRLSTKRRATAKLGICPIEQGRLRPASYLNYYFLCSLRQVDLV